MGKFIGGMIFALICATAFIYVYLNRGYIDLRADAPMSRVERFFVDDMMDNWAQRNAPKSSSIQPTEQNLIDAVRIYKNNCAVCHGSPNNPASGLAQSMYPRIPQFMRNAPSDMAEGELYYIVKHGVRQTGMPGWDKVLSDEQIWHLAGFLRNMEKLPPPVAAEWQASPQSFVPYPGLPSVFPLQGQTPMQLQRPQPQDEQAHHHHHHD